MSYFVRNMTNKVINSIITGMIVTAFFIGILLVFGSVGTMDANAEMGVEDSVETMKWAVIGVALVFGSLSGRYLRGMI